MRHAWRASRTAPKRHALCQPVTSRMPATRLWMLCSSVPCRRFSVASFRVAHESRPYFLAREIARGEFVSLRVREQARARRENAVRIGIGLRRNAGLRANPRRTRGENGRTDLRRVKSEAGRATAIARVPGNQQIRRQTEAEREIAGQAAAGC